VRAVQPASAGTEASHTRGLSDSSRSAMPVNAATPRPAIYGARDSHLNYAIGIAVVIET